jgi:hypothetical protein
LRLNPFKQRRTLVAMPLNFFLRHQLRGKKCYGLQGLSLANVPTL